MKNSNHSSKILLKMLALSLAFTSVGAYADTTFGTLGTPTSQAGSLDDGVAFVQTLAPYNGSAYVNAAPLTGTVESFQLDVTGNSGPAGGLNTAGPFDVPINVEAYLGVYNIATNAITSVLYASGVQSIAPTATNKTLTFNPGVTYSLGANQTLALILSDYSYSVGNAPATYTPTDLNTFDNPNDNSSVALNYNDTGDALISGGNGGSQGNIFTALSGSQPHLDYTVDIGAVPEPSVWALMAVAGLTVLVVRRRWVS